MNKSNPDEITQQEKAENTSGQDSGESQVSISQIGRYRIERLIGKGGFGSVYLAYDEELDRYVAVKIPHSRLVRRSKDAESYLREARTVANLDHPNIVPVHDIGSTPEVPCYVVSKYVEGTDLATRLMSSGYDYLAAAELVATVASALHYAHKKGLVHRDVKPGNILLALDGTPYVVDFGLALREEDIGKGPRHAGTAAYMSPEQARGEGHRVDGRSDIFSLGVVLYQMLVGRRPFRGDTQAELLEQVVRYEPRPIRQYDERLPKELERICNRALAKRVGERYSSAHDLAEDLRHFVAEQKAMAKSTALIVDESAASETLHSVPAQLDSGSSRSDLSNKESRSASESLPVRIVPKGLRSFDSHDADFFLELLPGARDRTGLPDVLRFWKTKIEELDSENTFPVGMIYGQSGCGKSSMIRAGLLPRLSDDVISIYLEATPDETETRLLRGLRKRCRSLETNLSLRESVTALRRGIGIPTGKKVLIVIDQFEQWLHAAHEESSELVDALRQCDGGRVQCIVMVRDDFWMAATRFMRELDLRLLEGENSAAVDLFPLRHARKVLQAFGRAFGALPENARSLTDEQKVFLDEAIAGLAEEGKVVCVRLTLFAEMMKGRSWTPKTLKDVGGTKGIGATFLEETFSSSSAPPEHRYHQAAARKVLRALLPDSGTDIKGEMKSRTELLDLSGYALRPRDFDDLMQILDSELRLVTPTDPDGRLADDEDNSSRGEVGEQYYQLTHDYLVHSLRDWLTRKQKESRSGRAELQLNDRLSVWITKRESRYLPSLTELCNIRIHTDHKKWSVPQATMMRVATRHHLFRACSLLAVGLLIGLAAWTWYRNEQDKTLRTNLRTELIALENSRENGTQIALDNLEKYPRAMLREELDRQTAVSDSRPLQFLYAYAATGEVDVEELIAAVQGRNNECGNIATALAHAPDRSRAAIQTAIENADAEMDWELKSRLATLAMLLGDSQPIENMLAGLATENPIERAAYISEFAGFHSDLDVFATAIERSKKPDFVSGMVLATGRIPNENLKTGDKETWIRLLLNLYENDPHGGVHSAAQWAMNSWEIRVPNLETQEHPGWQITPQGLTLIRIPADTIERSPADGTHDIVIDNDFWMSDKEVTAGLFCRFNEDESYEGNKPKDWTGVDPFVSATLDHPAQSVSWIDALLFCNWLSLRENRKPCYSENPETGEWTYDSEADGYRLPSDVQWEYACRAGTSTPFANGSVEYLNQYALYKGESAAHVGGTLMCNRWGMFDMHGNVWEWAGEYASSIATTAGQTPAHRILRGGSRGTPSHRLKSDERSWHLPTHRSQVLGFRVALPSERTLESAEQARSNRATGLGQKHPNRRLSVLHPRRRADAHREHGWASHLMDFEG